MALAAESTKKQSKHENHLRMSRVEAEARTDAVFFVMLYNRIRRRGKIPLRPFPIPLRPFPGGNKGHEVESQDVAFNGTLTTPKA